MAIDPNSPLFKALLAMDSYNRGYGASLNVGSGAVNTYLGSVKIIANSTGVFNGDDDDVGFYAIAYQLPDNSVTIAYRGTDGASDVLHGYGVAIGGTDNAQAQMTFDFYRAVADQIASTTNANPYTADISTTGHSMGGGLAGFVAATYGVQAYVFDGMAYDSAASNLHDYKGAYDNDPALYSLNHALDPSVSADPDFLDRVYIGTPALQAPDAGGITSIALADEFLTAPFNLAGTTASGLELGENVDLPGLDWLALHSMSSLVIRMFASEQPDAEGYGLNWDTSAKYFWPLMYDDAFAQEIGIASGLSGTDVIDGNYAGVLRTIIAYSAVDNGADTTSAVRARTFSALRRRRPTAAWTSSRISAWRRMM